MATSFGSSRTFVSRSQTQYRKLKVLDEVTQGGRTFAGPTWTITKTEKVILVVDKLPYTRKRAARPAQEGSSEVKTFEQS
jgi:hypothetical protein